MTQAKLFDYDEKEDYYEDEEEVKTPRKPGQAPDGGWGWVVCVGAFLCCLLVQGLLYSFDVLKEDIATFYNVPLTSLESTNMLMLIFSLLGGPIASGLVKRFNHRKVTMAGSVVVCVSLLISTQMPNVGFLRVTYGVLAGLGLALVSVPAIVIVAVWFEQKRAFATGFAVMGAGAGVFIFGPLVKHLLENNDWRNTVVIIAAIFLNCAVAGALFRSLNHAKPKGMKRGVIQRGAIMKALIAEKVRQRTISNGSLDNCIITRDNRLIKIDKIDLRNKSNSYINRLKETFGFSSRSLNRSKNSLIVPKVTVDSTCRPKSPRLSIKSIPPKTVSRPETPERERRPNSDGGASSDSGCGSLENSPKLQAHSNESLPDGGDPWDRNLVVKLPPKEDAKASGAERNLNNINALNNLDTPGTSPARNSLNNPSPLVNNISSPMGSHRSVCSRVRTISNSTTQSSRYNSLCRPTSNVESVMTVNNMEAMEMMINAESEPKRCKLCYRICKMLELDLLRSPTFLLLALTGFLTMAGNIIPFYHLPIKAESMGVHGHPARFLISIVWVANMISRPIMGWIADRPWGNPIQLNNITLVLAGFLTFFSPMYKEYGWLVFYAVFFGIFTAAFITLRSIILLQLFSKDQLVCSYGLLTFFQGIGALCGYFFSDLLEGSMSFTVVGILLVAAGILGFPLPKVKLWEARKVKEFKIVHIEEVPEEECLNVESYESAM